MPARAPRCWRVARRSSKTTRMPTFASTERLRGRCWRKHRSRSFTWEPCRRRCVPVSRIGWLVAPAPFRKRALRIKQGSDLHASSLAQAIVADLLGATPGGGGLDFEARLVRLRRFYRARAAALGRALRAHLPGWRFSDPAGGFAIWARADRAPAASGQRRVDEKAFLEAAAEEGVMIDPGSMFRANRSPEPMAIRLCFSAAPPTKFDEAVRRLARAWRR